MEERSEPQISSMNSEPRKQDLAHAPFISRASSLSLPLLVLPSLTSSEAETIQTLWSFLSLSLVLQLKKIQSKASFNLWTKQHTSESFWSVSDSKFSHPFTTKWVSFSLFLLDLGVFLIHRFWICSESIELDFFIRLIDRLWIVMLEGILKSLLCLVIRNHHQRHTHLLLCGVDGTWAPLLERNVSITMVSMEEVFCMVRWVWGRVKKKKILRDQRLSTVLLHFTISKESNRWMIYSCTALNSNKCLFTYHLHRFVFSDVIVVFSLVFRFYWRSSILEDVPGDDGDVHRTSSSNNSVGSSSMYGNGGREVPMFHCHDMSFKVWYWSIFTSYMVLQLLICGGFLLV